VLWTIAALALVVATAQVAEAQREGGRRGGRGFGRGGFYISSVQLAAESEEAQQAASLTEDQIAKAEEINDQLRDDRREAFGGGGGGGDFGAVQEEIAKLNQEASAKLASELDDTQKKRLAGIAIQVNGAATVLNESVVASELSITDEQKEKLTEVSGENFQANMEAMRDLRDQDLSREEMGEKMQELRTEADKKLMAVLTSDQQSKYDALKGETVEIDRSQFRGGRGFGGGRGGRNRDGDGAGDQDRGA
jgi:Spy/CpxP family protein refolding chaperone